MKKSLINYNNICLKKKRDQDDHATSSTIATSSSISSSSSSSSSSTTTTTTTTTTTQKNLIFKTKFSSDLILTNHETTNNTANDQPHHHHHNHDHPTRMKSQRFKLKNEKEDFIYETKQPRKFCLKTSTSHDSFKTNNKVFNLKIVNSSDDDDYNDFNEVNNTNKQQQQQQQQPVEVTKVEMNVNKTECRKPHVLKFQDDDDDDDDGDLERFKKKIVFKTTNNNNNKKTCNLIKHKSMDVLINNHEPAKQIKRKIFNTKRDTDYKPNPIYNETNFETTLIDLNKIDEKNEDEINADDYDKHSDHDDDDNDNDHLLHTKTASTVKSNNSSKKTSPLIESKHSNMSDVQLRNSRKAYECEELGETQAFLDDIFYLMDGLNSKNKLSDRCLCALKLAEMCLSSEFRMNLRISNDYINKMFTYLKDSPKYQSLALCTSLIMFALNQDKLIMEMEKETFNLLVSIINMNITLVNNGIELVKQDQETNDNEIYVKIYERCKDLCKKLIQTKSGETDEIFFANEFTSKKRSPNSKQQQNLEFNDFNPKLLAIECLLSMNLNKQNHNSIDLFKHELRDSGVLDKIIEIIKYTQTMIKQNKSHNNNNNNDELYYLFFIKKYNRYLNFLEILVQTVSSNTATSLTSNRIELDPPQNKKLKITSSNNNNNETTSCTVANQNYILNYKNTFVNELIKESLTYFYDELLNLSQDSIENDKKIQLLLNSVKENFLLIINLTHNNVNASKQIAKDEKLMKLIFKCISDITDNLNKDEQFDFLIMSMNILLNIFDTNYQHRKASSNQKFEFLTVKSFDIILNLYKKKEDSVTLAENDQENQLEHLAEQINTENAENINAAIMNSIHNAGKHMEDHLVAAYSALLIGHMLINQETEKLIDIIEVKSKLKDGSFKFMTQIIRKFIVFMKIMNTNGFSADDNLNKIINYLELI